MRASLSFKARRTQLCSQNHVVATAKDLLGRMAEGEIDPVEAMESLEAVEKRVGRTVARAESKAAKESKMAASRASRAAYMEGLAKSPYGTPDDGENGTLFSSKKIEPDNAEGEGREREYSILPLLPRGTEARVVGYLPPEVGAVGLR